MGFSLEELPIEILDLTLQHLPLSDLLSFARTSKSNYDLSIRALTSLDLAVFPRRIHSLLAFFDASSDDEDSDEELEGDSSVSRSWARRPVGEKSLFQVGLTTGNSSRPTLSRSSTPPSVPTVNRKQHQVLHQNSTSIATPPPPTPLSLRTAEINHQNNIATTVLSSSSLTNLRHLTLRLYDLTSAALAATLATHFTSLRTLSLDFSHPYIHDTTLPAKYWKETIPTGTPIWNIISGTGDANASSLKLHSLRSLHLTRSGITSCQLRHWVEHNPDLRELRLSLCRGVDAEFVTWLGTYMASGKGKLEIIRLTECGTLDLRTEADFAFVSDIAASDVTRELSLRGCKSVSEDTFSRLARPGTDTDTESSYFGAAAGYDEDSSFSSQPHGAWSSISKLVSPRGVVVKQRAVRVGGRRVSTVATVQVQRCRPGSVSPALTVSDGIVGTGIAGEFGKIEVDPTLAL